MKRVVEPSQYAWNAATLVSECVEDFLNEIGIHRPMARTRSVDTIAQIIQLSIDAAADQQSKDTRLDRRKAKHDKREPKK